ncbi:hypothetical protein [Halomonas organivorans]|uniref:Oxygen-independent coproporphyrinogen-3 oxidase n=1 Tax=Halomonas organivorans TaxID=257772 RepID=A0A7W5G6U1_9GAMM|nr:hypothetical protein [Halomonas organivorans]MBB3142938.1 oxygen-independent coproporphyrinogen-3 oxidase [Halomonas organivorans]
MPATAQDSFGADDYVAALTASNMADRPLSVHLRLPLCGGGAAREDTGMGAFGVGLARLDREMVLIRRCLSAGRRIQALHWEGHALPGMSLAQMSELADRLEARFALDTSGDRDFIVELAPRATDVFALRHLQALGFNRLKLMLPFVTGRRVTSPSHWARRVEPLLDETQRVGWHSLELVHTIGPWCQSRHTLLEILLTLGAMAPPRITLRPSGTLSSLQWHHALNAADALLLARGYGLLGPGAYARRGGALEDALEQARRETVRDRLGLGTGGVSRLPDAEARNTRNAMAYAAALDAGRLATATGNWHRADEDSQAAAPS